MGKAYQGKILTSTGFQYNANAPLDDRFVVMSYDDLADLKAYPGLWVFITALQKFYYYDGTNWKEGPTLSDLQWIDF